METAKDLMRQLREAKRYGSTKLRFVQSLGTRWVPQPALALLSPT